MTSARPVTPASGNPPAIPFAVVIKSGSRFSSSEANICPVRAKPVCTSSAIKSAPLSFAYFTKPGMKPLGGTINPPSPWIGSITIAAIFFPPISLSIL